MHFGSNHWRASHWRSNHFLPADAPEEQEDEEEVVQTPVLAGAGGRVAAGRLFRMHVEDEPELDELDDEEALILIVASMERL